MRGAGATAGRKRAAIELVAHRDAELRQTARRYSICEDDAEDAYQRALEILLVKAPTDRPRELVHWMKTVVKHEALAVRRNRERMLGFGDEETGDPIVRIAATSAGPDERTVRREQIARSREALRALKPAELRALTLLAAGYTYAEIGAATGFSQTKVNRCLAEGRERFRRLLSHSEDGTRCVELRPLLSAYCDGQASAADEAMLREHLRACVGCRATVRAYRAAPAAVAALAPALPLWRSLLERAQEFFLGLHGRLPRRGGGAGDGGVAQVAAGGGSGAAMAGVAKVVAICAGAVGGAACVATGVAPAPLGIGPEHRVEARIERIAPQVREETAPAAVEARPAPAESKPRREPDRPPPPEAESTAPPPEPVEEAAPVEYAPPPEPAPSPAPAESSISSGAAAGEFGP